MPLIDCFGHFFSSEAQQHAVAEEQLAMVGQLVTTLQQVATYFQSSSSVAPIVAPAPEPTSKIESLRAFSTTTAGTTTIYYVSVNQAQGL